MSKQFSRLPRVYTFDEWKSIIQGWKGSGLSIYQYCKKHEITDSAFRRWLNKVNNSHSPSPKTAPSSFIDQKELSSSQSVGKSSLQDLFIPVTLKPDSVVAPSSKDSSKVELTLSQGHKLLIQGPFDWDNVISLLTPLLTS